MDLQLQGKACLVTGASRGIGHGVAQVLAAEGVRVAILARRRISRRQGDRGTAPDG